MTAESPGFIYGEYVKIKITDSIVDKLGGRFELSL